ncbi:MAG: aryl-sulfate sulfotransferase [Planctomycetota bacterium]
MRYFYSALSICLVTFLCLSADAQQPFPGWNFYNAGTSSNMTHLVDLDGNVDHVWNSSNGVGAAVYLIDDGKLLRTVNDPGVRIFGSAGSGGRIHRLAWDSTIEWNYVSAGTNDRGQDYVGHHDIEQLPNGNVLFIAWERYSNAQAIAAGRNPQSAPSELWSEVIYEVEPTGPASGNIVWEWHVWDHLIQNFDPSLPNYGEPSDHPEKIDINYAPDGPISDWLHFNAIDYNPILDQIAVSSTHFDEFWVISHAPGDSGDLIYRYGNPQAYDRGSLQDQRLFGQHNIQWIEPGLDGAGNFLLFNNGRDFQNPRPYSSVDEIIPPLNGDGSYAIVPGMAYGPTQPAFVFDNLIGTTFQSPIMSGAQRLPNGNTLFNLGSSGGIHEIDANGIPVWRSTSPRFTFRVKRVGTFDPRLEGYMWFGAVADNLNIVEGFQHSGSLQDTYASDDTVLDVRKSNGPIVLEFKSTSPLATAEQITFTIESSHSVATTSRNPVVVTRQVELFNYQSGQWEVVRTGESKLVDSTVSIDITDSPDRFVDPASGCIEARLTFTKAGFARGLRITIDLLDWKFVSP